MASRNLELEILRHGRHEDEFEAVADEKDINLLRGILINWLQANRWDATRWAEFELIVRYAGTYRPVKKVRAR
jgi:hypothetical protein